MGRIGLGDLLRCFQAPTTCLFPRNSFPRIPGFSTTPHNIKTTTPSPSSCAVSSVHHIPAAATFYFFPSFCWHHLPYRLGMQEGLGQSTKSTIRSSEQSYMLVRAVRSCIAQQDVALHLGDTLPRKPSLLVARSHFLRAVGLERLAAALTGGHFSAAAHVNYCAAGVMYGKLCCAMETSVQRSGLDLQCRGEKKKKKKLRVLDSHLPCCSHRFLSCGRGLTTPVFAEGSSQSRAGRLLCSSFLRAAACGLSSLGAGGVRVRACTHTCTED